MAHDHHHEGSRFIAHHFDDAQHQFDSGKLGIWLFLVTEILFFSGLFVAYIIYRAQHPEIFDYAHAYLDTNMGAINTAVLIGSSLTAAWAVRAAQRNQQRLLVFCLGFTVLAAFTFLGIKYKEYAHKYHTGTLWGCRFQPTEDPDGKKLRPVLPSDECSAKGFSVPDTSDIPDSEYPGRLPPPNTGMFFSIYFGMTGLHGIHVLLGAGIFIWLTIRAKLGHFEPGYYGPVDYAALYWHLVDLIWIYLFPMLYLIH
jgi:cytochrome c oxidase subunit 3